jgi:hypothetical protein
MKIGYRGWRIRNINGQLTLCSPVQDYCWRPGENIALMFDEAGMTGFYGLKLPESVFEYFSRGDEINIDIIGEVLLYGNVIEGVKGFRGEKAMVGTLLLPTVEKYSLEFITILCNRYDTQYAVTTGYTRRVISRYRDLKARQRVRALYGNPRRCTAGGRAIGEVRRDGFLL